MEQSLPDEVCLSSFAHTPKRSVRNGRKTKNLGYQIMVIDEFVDAPQSYVTEFLAVEVSVHINDGGLVNHAIDYLV